MLREVGGPGGEKRWWRGKVRPDYWRRRRMLPGDNRSRRAVRCGSLAAGEWKRARAERAQEHEEEGGSCDHAERCAVGSLVDESWPGDLVLDGCCHCGSAAR